MKLIVGLGNPGREYAGTRHNIGFRCLDFFARKHGISFDQRSARSKLGKGEVAGIEVVLAKPQTYMNRSGIAVAVLVRQHRVLLSDLLVIYDDVDLPLGKIRIRERGSAGGHNGMKSIIASLGSQEFPRVRVGAGPPDETDAQGAKTPEYVLSEATAQEKEILREIYPRVADAVFCILSEGITAAMNQYNQ